MIVTDAVTSVSPDSMVPPMDGTITVKGRCARTFALRSFVVFGVARSGARVDERLKPGARVTSERAGAPALAVIVALPDLPVREAREQAAVAGDQRIGHGRERLGKPAAERLPRLVSTPPEDACLRIASTVSRKGAGTRRDVPQVRVVGVDGDRPGVVAVASVI